MSQKITPNLWFNGNALEAAEYYVSVFPDGKMGEITRYPNSAEEGLAGCKDKFGLSWQIVPKNMDELMKKPGAFSSMMNMHKLVIADF